MNFAVGQILKMKPASRSHVHWPYYVEVLFYNPDAKDGEIIMTTNIPGGHKLDIRMGVNWEYHYPRMKIVGVKEKVGKLLLNQNLV